MGYYVVGDIHGCFDEWITLKNSIEKIDEEACFILLGDIIDRGNKTFEMLEWATRNITLNGKYQMILGNHEDMAINWIKKYLKNKETAGFSEYGIEQVLKNNDSFYDGYLKLLLYFLEKRPLYKYVDIFGVNFLLVHAYAPDKDRMKEIENGAEINMIDRNYFLWERVNSEENYSDKDTILIHGHTPTIMYDKNTPIYSNNVINLDTGSVFRYSGYNGRLTALRLEDLQEFNI
ncbi:metallophosphoesterase [Lachnospira multipara]|uniref:Serine/threonine protein phosphatase 1 n=1 Tax=Lachnospira multipara TaxID=28051 RepID=A0A1H5WXR6_9FIRM|nr:metallophosphoesterase [Lachnospira multipara]SEG04103.1 serine/threonine protein phosphatase 1 [Lachnospira multipara]